jgi:hypothetical protein
MAAATVMVAETTTATKTATVTAMITTLAPTPTTAIGMTLPRMCLVARKWKKKMWTKINYILPIP